MLRGRTKGTVSDQHCASRGRRRRGGPSRVAVEVVVQDVGGCRDVDAADAASETMLQVSYNPLRREDLTHGR